MTTGLQLLFVIVKNTSADSSDYKTEIGAKTPLCDLELPRKCLKALRYNIRLDVLRVLPVEAVKSASKDPH